MQKIILPILRSAKKENTKTDIHFEKEKAG